MPWLSTAEVVPRREEAVVKPGLSQKFLLRNGTKDREGELSAFLKENSRGKGKMWGSVKGFCFCFCIFFFLPLHFCIWFFSILLFVRGKFNQKDCSSEDPKEAFQLYQSVLPLSPLSFHFLPLPKNEFCPHCKTFQ